MKLPIWGSLEKVSVVESSVSKLGSTSY
jgi:hypothetical protein